MASSTDSNRNRVSARSARDKAIVLNLRRFSRPLGLTRLSEFAHLAPRASSSFIDLTIPEPEGAVNQTSMAISEEDIVEAKDPEIKDTDEWPSFCLRKVNVVSMRNGQLMSLLEAHQDNPVKVSGQLETVGKDQLHLIKDQKYKVMTIKLENVTNYAFAEYDDGSFGFWAAGKAGWFEIKNTLGPYQQILAEMNEAASMFYVMVDKTRKGRKDPSKMSPKDLDKYAAGLAKDYISSAQSYTSRVGSSDVQDGFDDHRHFLITSMLEGQELGSDWAKAPMLRYYKQYFPDEFAEIEARVSHFGAGGAQSMESQPSNATATSSSTQQRDRANPRTPVKTHPCETDSSDDGEGDEDEDGPARPSLRSHERKSILQPKGSKFSKKAAGRRNSLRAAQTQRNDDNYEDDEIMEDASPLAIATTSNHNKRQPPSGQNTSEAPYHEYLPDPYIEVKLVHYDLPTTLPQGPGDLWSCEFEGCFTRIYEGSTEEGKEKIKQHFREHKESAKEKIDLVMNERRPYLPVDNLVRRLQSFGHGPDPEKPPRTLPEKAAAANPEKKFPAPIRRRW